MYFRHFVVLCILLTTNNIFGQLDPNRVMHFNDLRGTTIYDIESDRMGNLWIGTQSGLVKFDGYDYTRYPPDLNDSTTMGELLVYEILEDQDGYLWIGSQGAIYRYNPMYKSFKRIPFDPLIDMDEFIQPFVATITSDKRGRIYFGIASGAGFNGSNALIYYDKISDSLKTFPYPDSMNLASVYHSTMDPDGNIWLLDFSGVYKIDTLYNISSIQPPEGIVLNKDDFLNGICIDSSGIMWVTTAQSALFEYNPKTSTGSTWYLPDKLNSAFTGIYTLDMEADHNQDILITSNLGLLGFDKSTKTFYAFETNTENQILNSRVNALHSDKFGNLWIGTESHGLLNYSYSTKLSSHKWDENDPASITSGWVYKIFENEDGSVWIATRPDNSSSGLTKMDPETGEITPFPYATLTPGLSWDQILTYMGSGNLLFESDQRFKILNINSLQVRDTVLDFLSDAAPVMNTFTDQRSFTWYCTYNGLYKYDPSNDQADYFDFTKFPNTSPASNTVTSVIESETQGLWIITNNGLFSYDYEKDQIRRHAADSASGDVFSSQDINSFYEQNNGIAWVGTWQGGLNRYDLRSGSIKVYTINDGLPSMSIQGILHDEKNNDLWLSTFQGISKLNIETEEFTNYLLADGIQGLLYADGQYLKTSSNTFIFGGSNGITYFNPDKVRQRSIPPKVYIKDFKIADKSKMNLPYIITGTNEKDHYTFSYNQNNISIDYTAIQYDNPQKNKFAYILENYDPDWREVDNIRSAVYYNLPPGRFTFRVKAANSNGVWNDTGAFIEFQINPPWWKTWWAYGLYALIFIIGLVGFDRFQRKRVREKQQKIAREKELAQAREIEKAYNQLKQTQNQLLHAEKMASLGELTAGIAHEIQNPLNFVNNFSEVNAELITELKEEFDKGNRNEVLSIIDDIKGNEEKIIFHGKRADAIVKNMLQHSRSTGDEKIPTDINALADEYLRLSYHGLRAKDKSFNADFITEFDEGLPKIKVVPQDIGRVLLNIINNAFHACAERSQSTDSNTGPQKENDFKPKVTVSTKKMENKIEIQIKDNGNGIPEEIKDKIFQPFFTTKPSGEGTGLGLSLSYDIITKGHGGTIQMETEENKGSEFIIQLPINE